MEENTNWGQSVAGIVLKNDQVLLARHTYGGGKGKLIIPGGYVKWGETPQDAVKREIMEETGIEAEPLNIAGIRFNQKDWYVIFTARYIGGEARSDHEENSEVVWMDIREALEREDVPELTKKVLSGALNSREGGLKPTPYNGILRDGMHSLYTLDQA